MFKGRTELPAETLDPEHGTPGIGSHTGPDAFGTYTCEIEFAGNNEPITRRRARRSAWPRFIYASRTELDAGEL
jgi:hypothetical protein